MFGLHHHHHDGKTKDSVKDSMQDAHLERLNKHEYPLSKPPKQDSAAPTMTFGNGCPIDNNSFSITAGENGPLILADRVHYEKLAHFDRERIPERVVHAKGDAAFGYFEVTNDITKYCKAEIFSEVGKKTPCAIRFSRVTGERGAADTERDPRGMAAKFYTKEGNWDLVANNFPVFFCKDPIKFVDVIHSQKRNPETNLRDPNMYWDFLSLTPESVHIVTMLFSDRGTPASYRHMHGYGNHSFKMVNAQDEAVYVKFHMITETGIKNLTDDEARILKEDPDYYNRDLKHAINLGLNPTWSLKIQIMPLADAANYKWDVLDVTKTWPHADYPLVEVGKIVLNTNPTNYHAEVEQLAFSPGNLVPGIELSEDRMLNSRAFSYHDTQYHRLTANFIKIPVNCPYRTKVANDQRDGYMVTDGGQGNRLHYEPNSYHAYAPDPKYTLSTNSASGLVQRHAYNHPNSDFEQAATLYNKVLTEEDRVNLVKNIVAFLGRAHKYIQERMVEVFRKVDPDYGDRVAKALAVASKTDGFMQTQMAKVIQKIGGITHTRRMEAEATNTESIPPA